MNLDGFIDSIITFGQNNPVIALAIAVVFFFLIFRRPKVILSLLLLALILTGLYYLIMDVSSSSKNVKHKLIEKSEQGEQ